MYIKPTGLSKLADCQKDDHQLVFSWWRLPEIPTLLFWLETSAFQANISGLPFSHNILLVFETLPSQRKIMFSLVNQPY